MNELDRLTQIISAILGNDNQARHEGETLLRKLRENDFNQYVYVFASLLNVSPSKEIRIFCVVHLRRLLSNYVEGSDASQWHRLPNETQKFLKQLLIEVLSKEQDGPTRRVLCDLIGELCATIKKLSAEKKAQLGDEGKQWDSLMQNIWAFLTSGNTILMESALKILGILFVYCGQEFAQHKNDLFPVLRQTLEHEDLRVKASAIEAISNFVGTIQTKHCQIFKDLIPLMINAVLVIIDKNEDLGTDVLNEINDMVGAEPKIFKQHFKEFLDMLRAVTQMNLTIDTIKGTALEIIVLTFEMLPSQAKANTQVIKEFFECVFSYMVTCIEEPDKEWLVPPEGYFESNDDSDPHDASIKYSMHLIDRVVYKLGEKVTIPIFSLLLTELVKISNWQYRYAALMGLSQVGEYISDHREMDDIVNFVLKFLKDQHPKVRFAALQCFGQFADDSKPEFQQKYTDKVLPALIELLNDPVPRVISHALAALTNFLDGCAQGSVSSYILQILEPSLSFLSNGISLVKEGAMSTIATLAEACQREFIPYWEKTAQIVFTILKNTTDKAYKQVRGQAIECLVLIGESVGKEEFKKGAHDVIEKLLDIQKNYVEEVDPQKVYLLSGWQRICLVLQEDFIPYLEHILPSLFTLIEGIIHSQRKRQGDEKRNDTQDVISALGGGKEENKGSLFHKANTSESQEVVVALKMINVFVLELRKGFGPYVEKTSDILTHLLQKSTNVNVKTTAARGLPGLVKVVKEMPDPNKDEIVRVMANNYVTLLWGMADDEIDPETRLVYVMVMRELLKAAGRFMNEQEVNAMSENILRSLKESDEIKVSNEELIMDDDNDVDENEVEAIKEENANEEEFHCAVAELIGALFETHQELTLPLSQIIYTKVLPNVLVDNMTSKMYKFGLFLVDNMVEHLGMEFLRNEWISLSEVIIRYTINPKAEVRHPAAYGVGLLAERTKENFQGISDLCLKALIAALQIKKPEGEDQVLFGLARDNTIAALGKIIKFQPQCINVPEVTQVWFKLLPLRYDKKEARDQHDLLVDIILHSDPSLIFGAKGENLPLVVKLFALIVNTKFASPEFRGKMQKVVEALASKPETKVLLQDAFNKMENNLKEKMKIVLG